MQCQRDGSVIKPPLPKIKTATFSFKFFPKQSQRTAFLKRLTQHIKIWIAQFSRCETSTPRHSKDLHASKFHILKNQPDYYCYCSFHPCRYFPSFERYAISIFRKNDNNTSAIVPAIFQDGIFEYFPRRRNKKPTQRDVLMRGKKRNVQIYVRILRANNEGDRCIPRWDKCDIFPFIFADYEFFLGTFITSFFLRFKALLIGFYYNNFIYVRQSSH